MNEAGQGAHFIRGRTRVAAIVAVAAETADAGANHANLRPAMAIEALRLQQPLNESRGERVGREMRMMGRRVPKGKFRGSCAHAEARISDLRGRAPI